jgi:serine/threonine-protein kinase/endoribonuclease IRE1
VLAAQHLEAATLIGWMLATHAPERPSMEAVVMHPYWWPAQKRIDWMQHFSECFGDLVRRWGANYVAKYPAAHLESLFPFVVRSGNWKPSAAEAPGLAGDIQRHCATVDWTRFIDLSRAVRNKSHHSGRLPPGVRNRSGVGLPTDCLEYFCGKYPRLLLATFHVATQDSDMCKHPLLATYWSSNPGAYAVGSARFLLH